MEQLLARIRRRTRSEFCISLRTDPARAQHYGFLFESHDAGLAPGCPSHRGQRWPDFWDPSRGWFNHCSQPRPVGTSRRFLERFELPDRGGCEWAAQHRFTEMVSIPFVRHGIVFGKMMLFPDGQARPAEEFRTQIAPLLRELEPLWFFRHFLHDVASMVAPGLGMVAGPRESEAVRRAQRTFLRDREWLLSPLPTALRAAGGRLVEHFISPAAAGPPPTVPRLMLFGVDPWFGLAVSALLVTLPGLEAAECATVVESLPAAVSACRHFSPDFLLAEASATRDSATSLARFHARFPRVPILAVTENATEEWIAHLAASGVRGCVLRSRLAKELPTALARLRVGRTFYGEGIADLIGAPSVSRRLTGTELGVLRQAALGRSNKEIAAAMSIAERTVKFHLSNGFGKLGARSRTEAIFVARRAGLL